MIGYKILTPALCSLSSEYGSVQYGTDWIDVPGHGAYVGLTLPGLLRGDFYEPAVLAEMEYEDPTHVVDDGHVITARRVRIVRSAPVDRWHLVRAAIYGAKSVAHLSADPGVAEAITAAERCERVRTPEAAWAAWAAGAVRAAAGAAGAAGAAAAAHIMAAFVADVFAQRND